MAAVNFDEMVKKMEGELEEIRVRDYQLGYQLGYKTGYHDAMLTVKRGLGEFLSGLEK